MRQRLWSGVGLAVLAGALLLLSPGESQAQRRGFGGWGRGGVGMGYGGYGGYGYGQPFGYGYGYGYPSAFGYGGLGGYYGGYPGSYGGTYAYSPGFYGGGYNYGTPSYAYNPQTTAYQSFYPADGQQTDNTAIVRVMVPADAEVSFDGAATQQRGPMRVFQTPQLDPGRTYTYQVRAKWTENGKDMEQTRPLQVQANRTATLDFNSPAQQQQQEEQKKDQKQQRGDLKKDQ
jgi:uncharacterized protein (TIGR03000 family)